MHVIAIGTPGVGKSFILNALLGEIHFRSGVCVGQPLTTESQSIAAANGTIYIDTPGFDAPVFGDTQAAQVIADDIADSLSIPGAYTLVFVATLESGRVRSTDLAVVQVVLSAMKHAGIHIDMRNKYSVLINNCGNSTMHALQSDQNRDIVQFAFSRQTAMSHMEFFPEIPSAIGQENYLHVDACALTEFVKNAPVIVVPPGKHIKINARQLTAAEEVIEDHIDITRQAITVASRRATEVSMVQILDSEAGIRLLYSLVFGPQANVGELAFNELRTRVLKFCWDVGVPLIQRLFGVQIAHLYQDDNSQQHIEHAVDY